MARHDLHADDSTGRRPTVGLRSEVRIIWLECIDQLDYVREAYVHSTSWRERPSTPSDADRLVGYAVLAAPDRAGVPAGELRDRRIFYLKPGDRDADPDEPLPPSDPYAPPGAPCEAVDPRTVAPGEPGVLTERVWSGSRCDQGSDSSTADRGGEE